MALRAASSPDPKADALCTQVRRVLDYVVGGELRDEALRDLVVVDVIPAGGCRRMRAVLRAAGDMDCAVALERLEAARGYLRVQIAEAIHRKRTPELVFEVILAPGLAHSRRVGARGGCKQGSTAALPLPDLGGNHRPGP